jgi:hypothetical protein
MMLTVPSVICRHEIGLGSLWEFKVRLESYDETETCINFDPRDRARFNRNIGNNDII